MAQLGAKTSSCVFHYIHTFVGLGFGLRNDVNEAAAVAHAFAVGTYCDMSSLLRYTRELARLYTDMGTELGLSTLCIDAAELLSTWMRNQ